MRRFLITFLSVLLVSLGAAVPVSAQGGSLLVPVKVRTGTGFASNVHLIRVDVFPYVKLTPDPDGVYRVDQNARVKVAVALRNKEELKSVLVDQREVPGNPAYFTVDELREYEVAAPIKKNNAAPGTTLLHYVPQSGEGTANLTDIVIVGKHPVTEYRLYDYDVVPSDRSFNLYVARPSGRYVRRLQWKKVTADQSTSTGDWTYGSGAGSRRISIGYTHLLPGGVLELKPETNKITVSLDASTVIFNRSEEGAEQKVVTFTNASTVEQGHIHPDDYKATEMINFSYEIPRGEYVVDDYWLVDKFSKRVEVQQFPGQKPGYVTCFKPSGCLSQAVNLQLGQVYEARMKTRRVEGLSRTVPVYIHDTVPGRAGTKLIVYDLTANEYVRDGQPVRVGHELMVTVRLTKAGDTVRRGNLYVWRIKDGVQRVMSDVVYPTPNGYALQFTVDPDKHNADAYWAGFKVTTGGSNKVPSKISTLLVQQPLIGGTVSVKDYQTGSVMYSGQKIILRTSPDPNYKHNYFLVDGVPQTDSIYQVTDDDLVVRVSAAYESTLTPSDGNARILYNQPKHGVLRLFHVGPDTVVTSGSELPIGAKVKGSLICGPGYRAEDIRLAVGGEEPRNQGNPCVVALTEGKVYTFFGIVTQDATGPGQAMLNIEKPQNGSIVVNDEASGESYTNGDVLKADLPLATYAMADDGYRTTEFKVDGTACTSPDWRMEFTTVAGREHMLRAKTVSDASAENYSWIYIHPPKHGTITVFNEDDGNKQVTSGAKVLRNARLRVEYVSAPEYTLDTLYVNSDAYLAVPHRFRAVKGRYDIKVKTRVGFNENPEYPIDVQLPLGQGKYWIYNESDHFEILNGLAEAGKKIIVTVKSPEGSTVKRLKCYQREKTFTVDSASINFTMRAQTEIVEVEYNVQKSKILWDVPDMGEGQVLICREGQTTPISQGELVKVGDRLTMYVVPAAKKELRNITCNYEKVATSSPYTFAVDAIPVHHMRASFDDVPSAPGKAMIIIHEIAGQYTLRATDISAVPPVPILSMGSMDAGHTVQLEGTILAGYEFDGLFIETERRESLYETFVPQAGKVYHVRMQTKPSSGSGGMVILHIEQPIGATIIVTDAFGATIPDGSMVEVGRTFNVAAIAQVGKKVERITLNGSTLVDGASATFVVPAEGARIAAVVKDDGNSVGSAFLSYEQPIHGSLRVYDPITYKSYPHGSVVPANITLRAEAANHAGYVVAKIVIDGVDFTGDVADFKTVAGATHILKAHLDASPGTPGKAFLILEDAAQATIAVKNVSTGQWYTSYSRVEENTALYAVATALPGFANPQVIKDGITFPAAKYNFSMPGRDVTLSATATAVAPPSSGNSRIIIHQPLEGGTIAVTKVAGGAAVNSGDELPLGTELKVLITTETDYRVETLTVQGVDYPRLKTMEFKAEKEICEIRVTLKHVPGAGQSHILTLEIGEGSTLTVTDGTHELFSGADVFQGTMLTFNAELKLGYQNLKLFLNGAEQTESLVEFPMPDKPLLAKTSAKRTPVPAGMSRIHITQPANGTISIKEIATGAVHTAAENDVPLDAELEIYVDPDAGYMVDKLTIDGVDFPRIQLMNFTPSLTEHHVSVTLKKVGGTAKAYPLVLKRGTGTTLTVTMEGVLISSGQGVFAGKRVDVKADVEDGYMNLKLKVDGNLQSSPHNFPMPTHTVTIETTAEFATPDPGFSRIIVAQPATGGSIKVFQVADGVEVVSGGQVPEGTQLRVEVTTETDYQVRELVINDKKLPRAKIHTFTAYESVYKISVDLLHKPGAGNSYCLIISEAPGTTIDVTEGGVKLVSGSDVFAGTTLKAVAKQLDGYENMKLFINDVEKGYVSHFKMPEQNTLVRTTAKAIPVDPGFARILITQPSEGGWIVVRNKVTNDSIPSGSVVNLGTRLTVEVRLAENYLVKDLKIGDQTFPGIQYREFTVDYSVCEISATLDYKPNAGTSYPLLLLQGDGTTLTAKAGGKTITSGMGVFENTKVDIVAALQNGHKDLKLFVDGTEKPATTTHTMPKRKSVVESKATPIAPTPGNSRILIYQPFEGGTISVTEVDGGSVVNNGDEVALGIELKVVVNTEPNYKVRTLKIGDRLYPGVQEKQFFADADQYIIKVDLKYLPGTGQAYPLILNQGDGTTLTAEVAGLPILSGASVSANEKVALAAKLLPGHQDLKLFVDGTEQPNPASAEFNMLEKRTVVESQATITPPGDGYTRVIIYQPAEGGTISVTRVSDGSVVRSGDAVLTNTELKVLVNTDLNYKVRVLHLGDLTFANKHEQEFALDGTICIIKADLMYLPGAGQAHPLILQQGNGTTLTVTVDGVTAASGDGVFVGQEVAATATVLVGHEDLELLINGALQGSTSTTFAMPDKRTIVATKAAVIVPSVGNARIFIYQPAEGGTIAVTKVSDNSVVNNGDEVPLRTKLRVTVSTALDYRVKTLHLGSLSFAGKQEVEFKVEEEICHIKVDLLYIPGSGQSFPLVLDAGEGTSLTATADGKPVTSGDGVVVGKKVVANARLLSGYEALQLFVDGVEESDPKTATFDMKSQRTVVATKAEMQPAAPGFSRIIIQQPIEGGTITVMNASDGTDVKSGDVVPQGTALTIKVNPEVDYAVEQLIINGEELGNIQERTFDADLNKYVIGAELKLHPGMGQSYPLILVQGLGSTLTAMAEGVVVSNGVGIFEGVEVYVKAEAMPNHDSLELFIDDLKQASVELRFIMPSKRTVVESRAFPNDPTAGNSRIYIYQPAEGGSIVVTKVEDGSILASGDEVPLGTELEVEVKSEVDYFVKKLIISGHAYDSVQLKVFKADLPIYTITAELYKIAGAGQAYPLVLKQGSGTILTAKEKDKSVFLANGASVFAGTDLEIEAKMRPAHENLTLIIGGTVQTETKVEIQMPSKKTVVESTADVIPAEDGNSRILITQPAEGGQVRVFRISDNALLQDGDQVKLGTALRVEVLPEVDYFVKRILIGSIAVDSVQETKFVADLPLYDITAELTCIPGAGKSYTLELLQGDGTILTAKANGKKLHNGAGVFEGTPVEVSAELLSGFEDLKLYVNGKQQVISSATFDMPAEKMKVESKAAVKAPSPGYSRITVLQPTEGARIIVTKEADNTIVVSGTEVPLGTRLNIFVKTDLDYTVRELTVGPMQCGPVMDFTFSADLSSYIIKAELKHIPGAGQSYPLMLLQGQGTTLTATVDGLTVPNGAGVFEGKSVAANASLLPGHENLALIVDGTKVSGSAATFVMLGRKMVVESTADASAPSAGMSRILIYQPPQGGTLRVTKVAGGSEVNNGDEVPLGTELQVEVLTDVDYAVKKLMIGALSYNGVQLKKFTADLSKYAISAELLYIPGAGQSYPVALRQGNGTILTAQAAGRALQDGSGVFAGTKVTATAKLEPGHDSLTLTMDGVIQAEATATLPMPSKPLVVETTAKPKAATPGFSRIFIYQPTEGGRIIVTQLSNGKQVYNGDEVMLGTALEVEVKSDVDYFVKKLIIGGSIYDSVQLKSFTADHVEYAITALLTHVPGAGQSYPLSLNQGFGTTLTATAGGNKLHNGAGVFEKTPVAVAAELLAGHEGLELFVDDEPQPGPTATFNMPARRAVVESKAKVIAPTDGNSRILIYQPVEGGSIRVTKVADGEEVKNGDEVPLGTALIVEVKSALDYRVKTLTIGDLEYSGIQYKAFTAEEDYYMITAVLTHIPGAGQSYPLHILAAEGTTLIVNDGAQDLADGQGVFENTTLTVKAELLIGYDSLQLFIDSVEQMEMTVTFEMPARAATVKTLAGACISVPFIFEQPQGGTIEVTDRTADGLVVASGEKVQAGHEVVVHVRIHPNYTFQSFTINGKEQEAKAVTIFVDPEETAYHIVLKVEAKPDNTPVESEALARVLVGPNPFTNQLHLLNAEGVTFYQLFDPHGVVVLQGANNGETRVELPVERLAEGFYLLRLKDVNGVVRAIRVVKQ